MESKTGKHPEETGQSVTKQGPGGGASQSGWGGEHWVGGKGGTKGIRAGALGGHRSMEKGRAGGATPSGRIWCRN